MSLEQTLAEFRPDVVGISMRNADDIQLENRQTYFGTAVELCRKLRQLCAGPIVLGGTAFSIFPEELLTLTGADFGVQGAGEVAFNRLIQAIATGSDPSDIRGLVYRRGETILLNPSDPEEPIYPQAAVRSPDLADFYLRRSTMLNIATQRGCNLKCCYCTYPLIEGRQIRCRDPEAVADELTTIQGLGAKHAFIVDAVFNLKNDHVVRVCEAILRQRIKLTWTCFLRPKNLTREVMGLMARAGLTHIEFGTDSFCDSVLEEYGKAFTFEDIFHSNELARAAHVYYAHFLVCGGPGETRETMETGFRNSQRLTGAIIFALAGMRIYPGTPLFARAQREGALNTNAGLLEPTYYISPKMSAAEVLRQLSEFKERSPNWVAGSVPPEAARIIERLRSRGVVGPPWQFYGLLQRFS